MGAFLSVVPAPLDALAEQWWGLSTRLLRTLIVGAVGVATGQGEVERICAPQGEGSAGGGAVMAKRLLRALRLSSASDGTPSIAAASADDGNTTIQALVLRPTPFDPQRALEIVALAHGIELEQALVRRNLARCLQVINHANRVAAAALKLQQTPYDAHNAEHEATLEALWTALKPGVKRQGGRVTTEWGEVGFQGKDPATDFRGMGLLGLQQLLHFASTRPEEARALLLESHHPRRFFPFAATGINVSGFVLALLAEERLLDELLVEQASATSNSSNEAHGGDEAVLVQKGLELVHGVYADVFQEFGARWVSADPPNIMAFPPIFEELKVATRRRLRLARGDLSLWALWP